MLDKRLEDLRAAMASKHLDALLVTDIHNVFYMSGFTGDTGELVVTGGASYLLVDPRFTVQARSECAGAKVVEYTAKTDMAAAADLVNDLGPRTAGYESDNLAVASFRQLRILTSKSTSLRATDGVIRKLRRVKDARRGRADPRGVRHSRQDL